MNPNQRSGTKEKESIDPFNLNMDCWLLICQYLELRDVLNLSTVSTAYNKFVGNYLLPMGFKKFELSFMDFIFMGFNGFEFILESVQNTVQELLFDTFQVIDSDDKAIKLLTRLHFPSATKLCIDRTLNEDRINDLSRAFPNLQSLSLEVSSGALNSILRFKHLENLTLTNSINIDFCEFQDLFIALNLKSLALGVFDEKSVMPLNRKARNKLSQIHNLTLNCFELNWLSASDDSDANNAIVYKNLKSLTITNVCDVERIHNLFRDMESIVDREAYELEINDNRVGFLHELMVPEKYDFLNRVNTLIILNAYISLETPGAPNIYKALRELHFCNCNAASWENIMLNICSNAVNLDLLSVEGFELPEIANDKHLSALMVREKPITFNWYDYVEPPIEFCSEKYKGLIKFKQRLHIFNKFDESYITIKFRP